jgi:hypothetical protein
MPLEIQWAAGEEPPSRKRRKEADAAVEGRVITDTGRVPSCASELEGPAAAKRSRNARADWEHGLRSTDDAEDSDEEFDPNVQGTEHLMSYFLAAARQHEALEMRVSESKLAEVCHPGRVCTPAAL